MDEGVMIKKPYVMAKVFFLNTGPRPEEMKTLRRI